MKKLLPIVLVIFFSVQSFCFAWDWEPYGPEGIKANKLCFFEYNDINAVICIDTGMFVINSIGGMDYVYYSYTKMKVVEAVSAGFGMDSDSVFLIMSDGSWSDGIYSFNGSTGLFAPLHFCYSPNFIVKAFDKYFVGYNDGLLMSEDGIIWNNIPFFDGITCIDMATNYEDFIVTTNSETNNTYLSNGDLNTWNQLTSDHITELSDCNMFNNFEFYGIIEGATVNSGFYHLDVDGSSWNNVFYSDYLNAVGTDNGGCPFVGWYQGVEPYIGIAKCYPELTFLNDGLPNLNIHAITAPVIWGATVVYCCTDNGIYSRVLSVGVSENTKIENINIYPNPVSSEMFIKLNSAEPIDNIKTITILNNQGEIVDNLNYENQYSNEIEINWNKGNLPSGVYYLVIKTGKEQISEKFIIL